MKNAEDAETESPQRAENLPPAHFAVLTLMGYHSRT